MQISNFDRVLVLIAVLLFVWGLVLYILIGDYGLIVLVVSVTVVILKYQNISKNTLYRKGQKIEGIYMQIESLLSLYNTLGINKPMPNLRGFAASPDFLNKILEICLVYRPMNIVELGSGSSSIITGYFLKNEGEGKLTSFDHLQEYKQSTEQWLRLHGLEDYVEVVHAPLISYEIENKDWKWYDISKMELNSIDLLIVDGPPEDVFMTRFPAVPLLEKYFHDDTWIILDDALRPSEQSIIQEWIKLGFQVINFYHTEKGTCVMKQTK